MAAAVGTRGRIFAHAEGLFARKGPYETTVRDIVKEAGVSVGALNYHFGSKDRLIAEVVLRVNAEVQEHQEERMRGLLAARRKPTVDQIARAWVEPYLDAAADPAVRRRLSLIGAVFGGPDSLAQRELYEAARPLEELTLRLLERVNPRLSASEARSRLLGLAAVTFFYYQGYLSPALDGDLDADKAVLAAAMAGMLAAPPGRA